MGAPMPQPLTRVQERRATYVSVVVAEIPPDPFGCTFASAIHNHAGESVPVNATHRKAETTRQEGRRKANTGKPAVGIVELP